MKMGAVAARGACVLVVVAAACSSDDTGPEIKCGAGTVLKDNECVVASGGTASGGSQSTQSGSPSKGGTDGQAGSVNGGTVNGGGADPGMNGGAADGGADSMTGEAGSGGDGPGPDPEPEVLPTRWYVFSHEKGVFAYDTTKFPATDALLTMSSKAQYGTYYSVLWSPNGRSVLYSDAGVYHVSELTDGIGSPRLMFNAQPYPQGGAYGAPYAWSADSQSLAILTGTSILVTDPAQAGPTLYPVTTTAKQYRWAPTGNRLFYTDGSGSHVVQVDHGKPGTPIDVEVDVNIGRDPWVPNGTQLVATQNGDVTLTTLSGSTASTQVLTTFNPPSEPVSGAGGAGGQGGADTGADPVEPEVFTYPVGFAPDGSTLLFNSRRGNVSTAYTLALKPSPGAPKAVVSGAPNGTSVSCDSWSPDGTLINCRLPIVDGYSFIADAAGGAPIRVRESEANGDVSGWVWSPNPAKRHLIGLEYADLATKLRMLDLAKPKTTLSLYNGSTQFALNSAGTLLTYAGARKVHLVNLATPAGTHAEIVTNLSSDTPVVAWSPDGQFISVTDSHQEWVVRVDGVNVSSPVALQVYSKNSIYGAWQP